MERPTRKDLEKEVLEKNKEVDFEVPDFDDDESEEDDEEDIFREYIQVKFPNGVSVELQSSKFSIVGLKLILFEILDKQGLTPSIKRKENNYCG